MQFVTIQHQKNGVLISFRFKVSQNQPLHECYLDPKALYGCIQKKYLDVVRNDRTADFDTFFCVWDYQMAN